MKLSELKTGERGVIVKVHGHGSFRKRIIEMGFVKGNKVKVILNAPLKDPIEYEIIGYKISLRRDEAAMIEVIGESETVAVMTSQALPALEDKDSPNLEFNGDSTDIEAQMINLAENRRKVIKVALVGNPNCGKTSLFNRASGSHEHVGNYSGVTVDAKEGHFEHGGYKFTIVDLPGTYSLSAYSPEERYVRKNLIEEVPDVVINVVDASNLQRNLYLTTQLIDMNLRVVMALNMYDELQAKGDSLDIKQLGYLLGMPIVPTISRSGEGIDALFDTVINIYENSDPFLARHIHINHGVEIEQSIDRIKLLIQRNPDIRHRYSTRYLAIKYLENDSEFDKVVEALPQRDEIISARFEEQKRIKALLGSNLESSIVDAKYAFVQGALAETWQASNRKRHTLTDKIDAIVTNKWLAFPIFFFLLYAVFEGTFVIGEYPMRWIEWLVSGFGSFVASVTADGWVKDLLVDGVIGGVGSVLVFLPNILILYAFLSLMEDSGYMARAAFIMDRLMHKMGLHGKSFIPMIMGFGCNVPAVMATRTIESRKSRLITMLIIPFMSCAGRMPVFILLAGAFFPAKAGLVLLGLYALGIVIAVLAAMVMSRFFKDDDLPFVMELPPYRVPTAVSIFRHTWEKGKQYLHKMSGIILICSVVIWFLGYFPNHDAWDSVQEQQEHSFIGYVGKAVEPVLEPLGFDWRMGVGIFAGVGAKELIVSTLGVMYADDEPVASSTTAGGTTSAETTSAETTSAGTTSAGTTPAGTTSARTISTGTTTSGIISAEDFSVAGTFNTDASVAAVTDAAVVSVTETAVATASAEATATASASGTVSAETSSDASSNTSTVPSSALNSTETPSASAANSAETPSVEATLDENVPGAGDETRLQKALVRSVTPAGALAYMVFVLLYFPCIATVIAIKQESGGWKWAILAAVYTIVVAWVAAFATYHIASLFF